MKRHLPNFLTLGRMVLVPPIVVLLLFPGPLASALAGLVFLVASLTDLLDGMVARKWGVESSFGRFLDPIADKVLVTSALIMLIGLDRVPAWIVALIISREIAVSVLRGITKSWDTTLQPSAVGKLKAVFQFAAVVPLIVHYTYDFVIPINFHKIGMVLLYVALALTLWSGIDYFLRFYREYESREKDNG